MCILKRLQGQCKPNAQKTMDIASVLQIAEAKPVLAAPFSKRRCKGTTFCAHSQTKCTKIALLCTKLDFCANIIWLSPCFFILLSP